MAKTPEVAALIASNEKLRAREHEANAAAKELELALSETTRAIDDMKTNGLKRLSVTIVGGFTLGAGLAYLAHDELANAFGKGSLPALAILPGAGLFVLWKAPKFFKKKKNVPLMTRAGTYGAALGVLAGGLYLSWEDYAAMNPPKK